MAASVTDYQITSAPNNSLTATQRLRLFLLLAVIPLLVGIGFMLVGLWMVLPFVGLELLALGWAFYYVNCHAHDYERISIQDDQLIVARRNHTHTSQLVLNPYWAQVVQDQAGSELHLYLRSHGKQLEIGLYMNDEQRAVLAAQLKKRTGAIPPRIEA